MGDLVVTTAIIIYVTVSLVLGGLAATYEIWYRPADLPRADGKGTYPAPKVGPIGMFLFVATLWPILLIWAFA
jgi:hypothetical protein